LAGAEGCAEPTSGAPASSGGAAGAVVDAALVVTALAEAVAELVPAVEVPLDFPHETASAMAKGTARVVEVRALCMC
jgi:hypothetical protein